MLSWWRRFVRMPDADRAKLLASVSAVLVLFLLYALGGLSLYLRSRYLKPTLSPTASQLTPALEQTLAITLVPSATPTLYPTITPFRVEASAEDDVFATSLPAVGALASFTPLPTRSATATPP